MAVPPEVVEEYKTYITENKKNVLSEAEQEALKELGEKRKAFLKAKAEELGMSAGKLEKAIGKLLKKTAAKQHAKAKAAVKKPKDSPSSAGKRKEENEEVVESQTTTLERELRPPEENKGRGGYYVNSEEILMKHLEATGGKWMTRFPPEPNGFPHLGHAKAMLIDFGTAKKHGGGCYMRFDDTNPGAEKQEYIDSILKSVKWLGHDWYKQTATSDYFQDLFDLAVELIKRGKAYVCFQTPQEVKASRDSLAEFHANRANNKEGGEEKLPKGCASPYRDVSVEDNLKLFEKMRQGIFAEGECTLRMKQDLLSPNANMWDQMAYRIQYKEHPKAGDKWCIYPTYDYSHCLVDSLENITHSLCSLEFESRQSINGSYHWLVDALGMYHPQTWEFSRCSVSCNVMSKRRLNKLVMGKYVNGWDDPRLLTLEGLRRRGYTSTSINAFCEGIGVARSSNEVCIKNEVLEHYLRKELNDTAERRFAVVDPVKIRILNFEKYGRKFVSVPKFPQNLDKGFRDLEYTDVVYIPKQKFRLEKKKGFKGLVKGGRGRLLFADEIECVDVKFDSNGEIDEVLVEIVPKQESEEGKAEDEKRRKLLATFVWVSSTGTFIDPFCQH
uniref:glutamine--tRNA ligase n=1 Tax=Aplanochytrium stocchinoi TaxID=215587 RepID=A0A7S3PCJ7_9STRA|mmetsp:Transcript_20039/g.25605  ORF Transcript_20039/g.25605 Transcript_20039/m.25605 type:complete len:613 (-) Transcript_20039:46-1884(-)